jgi:hypothetical protein
MNRRLTLTDYLARLVGQPNLTLALGAFLMGLLGNLFADLAGGWALAGVPGNLIVSGALVGAVIFLYLYLKRKAASLRLQVEEKAPEGKAGLILLLSTFDPRIRDCTESELKQRTEATRRAADWIARCAPNQLTAADFELLPGTNLEPVLAALEWHLAQGVLRDCWTIGSPDAPESAGKATHDGSAWLGVVLQRWFEHAHPEARGKVTFHPTIAVPPRDYLALGQAVDRTFERAPYKPEHVICDITGGQKTMSIGAALACIEEGRTMQYMMAGRDWKGEPLRGTKIAPVLVDVSPYWAQRPTAPTA